MPSLASRRGGYAAGSYAFSLSVSYFSTPYGVCQIGYDVCLTLRNQKRLSRRTVSPLKRPCFHSRLVRIVQVQPGCSTLITGTPAFLIVLMLKAMSLRVMRRAGMRVGMVSSVMIVSLV